MHPLNDLLDFSNNFMPHGACFLWQPSILWLHVLSDAVIALSYFSIPIALDHFVKNRKELVFSWLFVLFGGFILLCGITHIISIWTIWHPDYWLDGFVKLTTAIVSLGSAVTIWRIMPQLLDLPSSTAFRTKDIFMRTIFNATPDAMVISNKDGYITMANKQAENLLGFSGEDLIGQPIRDFLLINNGELQADEPNIPEKYQSYKNSFAKNTVICVAKKKDKIAIDAEVHFNPIETNEGLFVVTSLRDITLQKKAETTLLENEERFFQLANNAATMIWITDVNGDFSFVNQYWRDFTGIDTQKITRSQWLELIHPDDRHTAFVSITDKKEPDHEVITTEYRLRNVNGYWCWILDTARAFYKNGVFSGFSGSAIDITARKEAEVELRVSAVAFETQEPLLITDANTVIQRVNNAFLVVTGYGITDVIGQKLSFLTQNRTQEGLGEFDLEFLEYSRYWQGEIQGRRKNGENFPAWLTVTMVKNEHDEVTHYVCTYIDITKRKLAENEIKTLAFYDALTQLPNRRLLQERLNHAIKRAQRGEQLFALMNLDLDRFKDVNDTLGHKAGDELLQQVAARIKNRLRAADTVARQGGDEFVVLLENIANQKDAARVAKRIVDDISSSFRIAQDNEVWINVSIGISLFPQHGANFEVLMTQADTAMYKAKEQGGGSIVYFSEDLTRMSRERLTLEGRLRKAIPQNELRVFFQPQIDIASDRIIGAEALVRWQDPTEGLIPPGRFIPIAEETNLIVAIGEWVLNETCKQGRIWLDMGLPAITLAVNVSTQQFKYSDIIQLVEVVVDQTGYPAQHLELEITESGLMKNQENAVEILNKLHALGVRIAIDDFGTGYSSLAYLKRFPLDVLKIDKSFIDDIPHGKDDVEIAATIISMANNLGFKVIAEGVETKEQLDFLRLKGCDSYQGYFKCRPIPIEEFTKLLQEQF